MSAHQTELHSVWQSPLKRQNGLQEHRETGLTMCRKSSDAPALRCCWRMLSQERQSLCAASKPETVAFIFHEPCSHCCSGKTVHERVKCRFGLKSDRRSIFSCCHNPVMRTWASVVKEKKQEHVGTIAWQHLAEVQCSRKQQRIFTQVIVLNLEFESQLLLSHTYRQRFQYERNCNITLTQLDLRMTAHISFILNHLYY